MNQEEQARPTFEMRSRVLRPQPQHMVEYTALFEERNRHIVHIDHIRMLMQPRIDMLRTVMAARIEALTAEMNSAIAEHEGAIVALDARMDPLLYVVNL